jgi:hypothetical protein
MGRAWPFFLQLIAKLKEFDEVGHRPFRVLAVGGEVGERSCIPAMADSTAATRRSTARSSGVGTAFAFMTRS